MRPPAHDTEPTPASRPASADRSGAAPAARPPRTAASADSPPRHHRDADATRAALLDAAKRRFVLLGYERTTTRDIAKDACVNLALINRYFGGKEGLFRAVLESAEEMTQQAEGPTDAAGLVDAVLDGLKPDAWPEFGGAHPLLLLMRNTGAGEEAEALRSFAVRAGVLRVMRASGVDVDALDPEARRDLELRAQLVNALLNGLVVMRQATPIEPIASAPLDELEPLLLDAIDRLLHGR